MVKQLVFVSLVLFTLFKFHSISAETDLLLAQTPPMGWNSWNTFGCNINEELILDTADAMINNGMRDAGYQYINIDDCWQARERDSEGNLRADPERFPSGMKALADTIHDRGFKFGIYTSVGSKTCQGFPGSLGHEEQDAELFVRWGVDFVKDDFCGGPVFYKFWPWWNYRPHYQAMSEALQRSGRPILFSICNWGFGSVWKWGKSIAHSWRTTLDIRPSWVRILQILDYQRGLEKYSGQGGWNDPDMLEVGVPPLSLTESYAHFSLWAILAAPLIAGNDVRNMSPEIRQILTNPEIIAVNQDPDGKQGRLISSRFSFLSQVWARPLRATPSGHKRAAVALLNRLGGERKISVQWKSIGLNPKSALVRDLGTHTDQGVFSFGYEKLVPRHGVVLIEVTEN